MTLDELKAYIQERKVRAFDLIRSCKDAPIRETGYNSYGELATGTLERAAKDIEVAIKKYEKENP